MRDLDYRHWEALKADRAHIDRAAAWLRSCAIQDGYAGLHEPARAFALAGLLDTLSLQLDRVPPGLREQAVRAARWVIGGPGM